MFRTHLANLLHSLADPWPHVSRHTRTVRTFGALKKAMGWERDPILQGDHLREYVNHLDLNGRRIRDAESIGGACANENPAIMLEIGTSHGHTTALMAQNAPQAIVHTINIPPEEIKQGGRHVTHAISREDIGRYCRDLGLTNIRQIYANTATWEPDFGPIDITFIDGCHDSSFVYNDTRKVLKKCRVGSLLLWHDFNPDLARAHDWLGDVCSGIERLLARRVIRGKIFRLQDSWVGIYRVSERDMTRAARR
ncbi:MAG: class I SAM-dependent methyltransferase [Planctomycetes bacterium]|nr:class I SAM-dependent methyltransferase [Planctomycetota bacterium]